MQFSAIEDVNMRKILIINLLGLLFISGISIHSSVLAQDSEKQAEQSTEVKSEQSALNVSSWGGAYSESQKIAFVKPFKSSSGEDIKLTVHSGDFAKIKENLSSSSNKWDVIDLGYHMVEQACKEDLLAPIDHGSLKNAPDGTAANEDFFDKALHKCGVASMTWASTIVYNTKQYRKRKPTKASDFFNLRRFKGKRTLPKTPKNLLELALLADGVKASEVYALLETREGVERAFKKLKSIKKHIIWWSDPANAFEHLNSGKASMGLVYNGRAFSVIAIEKKPLKIIWDGQLYDYNLWAIPKNANNKNLSLKFIKYATRSEKLAQQASLFPYGPARKSSNNLIKPHPEANIDLKPYIPTIAKNRKNALKRDLAWWEKNGERLQSRFNRWLNDLPEVYAKPEFSE